MKLLDRYKIVGTVSDQGVSEAVGFIIIFSLVMIGIGLVTLYGYPILLQQQSNANVRNMERDMIILQNDIKSLVYKNVPYKETSLQVSGGSLTIYNSSVRKSNFTLFVTCNPADPVCPLMVDDITNKGLNVIPFGAFQYDSDSTNEKVVLENGAVLYRQIEVFSKGSTMLAEPRWFRDDFQGNTSLDITFISFNSSNIMSINGVGTIKMRVIGPPVYVSSPPDSGNMTIIITYNPPYQDPDNDFSRAWRNYLTKSTLKFVNSGNDNIYTLNNVKTLIIKKYDIEIEGM